MARTKGTDRRSIEEKRQQAVDLWLQGHSITAIAHLLGRHPVSIWRWLARAGPGSYQAAQERMAQAEAVFWQRAWYWTEQVDRLRWELMRRRGDDPGLGELERQYAHVTAAYRDAWDKYFRLAGLVARAAAQKGPQASVEATRPQVIVVGAEAFYRRLQERERRRMRLAGAEEEEDEEGLREWLRQHAEIREPTERL